MAWPRPRRWAPPEPHRNRRHATLGRMKLFLSLLLALLLGPAWAGEERYQSDADHSFASFEFRHLGYSTQRSRFDKVEASIRLDREARSGEVTVHIDPRSVSTGSAAFNQTLQGPSFFDVAQFPDIRFTARTLAFDRLDALSRIDGELTLKGITRPVTLTVTHFHCMMHPLLRRQACGANATTTLSRSAFGLGRFTPLVGDEVVVTVAIEALLAP